MNSMISWNVVLNAISYQVVRKTTGSPDDFIDIYVGSDNNFHHAQPSGNFIVKIRARNDGGFGDWSNTLNYVVVSSPNP